ncbi:MAG: glycosyltransferase [Shimia sp.]
MAFGAPGDAALAALVLREGAVAPADLLAARARSGALGRPLAEVLLDRRMISSAGLARASRAFAPDAPSPLVPRRLPAGSPAFGLAAAGIALPLEGPGGIVAVALARPEDWVRHRDALRAALGPCRPVHAPRAAIAAAFAPLAAAAAEAAETRCPAVDSARGMRPRRAAAALLLGLAALMLALAPAGLLAAVVALPLLAGSGLRLATLLAAPRRAAPPAPGGARAPGPAPAGSPPRITMIVPLFREARIAERLMRRIEAVRWPRDALEVLLVHEAEDTVTAAALARARLPGWARVLAVPPGRVRTKPRALNFALTHSTGAIVGIWDAEDAPDPGQLEAVAARFAAAPPRIACLQGRLAFYNARASWLTRAFATDYAAWFGLVLPGLARLGLPVPLGGTTLFFRRGPLEAVGAWDAHNVTEDADLGVRLHRRGWRTELIDTETREEAVARPWAWVRQRSRWLKGYLITWAVHARRPAALWRDLGPAGFAAFHVHFLSGIAVLALLPPLWGALALRWARGGGDGSLAALTVAALAASAVHYAVQFAGASRTRGRVRMAWVGLGLLTLPLSIAAVWKALFELAVAPFWWDKTSHGEDALSAAPPAATEGPCPSPA